MTIRLAQESDYDGYYLIKSDDKNIFWGGWTTAPDYNKLKKVFLSRLSDSNRREYVCLIEEQIIGSLSAVIGSEVEISYGVLSSFTGNGVASTLIAFVTKEFVDKDIVAWVSKDNIGSEKCLLKNGFVQTAYFDKRRLQLDINEHIFYKWVKKSV